MQQELQRRLAERQQENAELARAVYGLEARYHQEIEPLQEEVLRCQRDQLRRAAQRHVRSARLRNAYHEAQEAYEEFQNVRSARPASSSGKALFRQAAKECHPDAVPAEYREEAAATFQHLEAAHTAGYSDAVRAIADALDEHGFPDPPTANEEAGPTPSQLNDAVSSLESSIQALRSTVAFRELTDAGSMDAAINARKLELARQMRRIENASARRVHA